MSDQTTLPGIAPAYTRQPDADTPAARLLELGPDALTPAELLSLIIGGPVEDAAPIVAGGLRDLAQLNARQMYGRHGLALGRAVKTAAAIELGRRAILDGQTARPKMDAPQACADYLLPRHSNHQCEVFGILALDSRHRLLGEKIVATGGRHSVAVAPADVFAAALPYRPRSVVVFHNHPSGDPFPSEEDKALTYRLARSGEVLGIAVVDHIVLGARSFESFKLLGLL